MKKFAIHIALLLGIVLSCASCSNDPADIPEAPGQPGEGAVSFAIAMPQSRAGYDDSQYPWTHCAIRIYKLTTDEAGDTVKELIRRYNSRSEMPASIWLLAGEYSIAVEVGSKAEASFDEPTYRGEKEFGIVEGETQSVEVECRIVNTIVKVIYDQSVPATFKERFSTTVAFDEATAAAPAANKGPHLTFEETKKGYFILPETATTLYWQFCGEGEKNGEALKLEKTGSQEISAEPGVCYELKFKYSKDLGGSLDFTLTLDENPDEVDDPIVFLPNPQITGGNFDLNDLQRFTGEALVLSIASIGDMQRVRIETEEGFVCEVPATSAEENADGIAVDVADPTNMTVMLGEKFFARFGGGNHVLTITAIDEDGGEGTKTMTVRTQGALSLASTDHWNARGILKAVAFDPEADDVKLGYRKAGDSEWSILPATSEENDIRSVEVSGIHAETEYEYRLFLGDEPVNGLVLTKTGSGPQVYNAGFETWSGSSPLLPYTSDADQWWDTGNHGSSKANTNVTTNEADARPGSAGTTSARLKSQKAAILGIGKFAAGNIFVGKYLGTDGTDGVIGFGKPFPFTYRPRQLKFWYKGTAGKVDYAGGKVSSGDTDVNQVYICLCKMEGPHVVATKRPDTFLDFATNSKTMSYCTSPNGTSSSNDRTDGRIIAWAEWNNTQSQADWTEIVLDLHYNEEYEGEMPTYLMLTASASKYGDYFAGSTSSCIYLDDFELVY